MNSDVKKAAFLEHLLLMGAIEIDGIDGDTGEMLYSITDKLEEVSPRMFEMLSEDFNSKMYEMIYTGPKVMKWKFDSEFFDG
jgi:hypothetical protein